MKRMSSSQQKNEEMCPYLKDKACGHPKKDPLKACESFKYCTSYKFLEETKSFFEEEKSND